MAHLNDELKLVVAIEREAGPIYIHHTPIRLEVFEHHFRLLAATHADMFGRGGAYANVAPRVAALTLRDIGKKEAERRGDDDDGGASALMNEIKRLSVVIAPHKGQWHVTTIDVGLGRKLLDEDEWREAESAIIFFTCVVWMTSRKQAKNAAQVAATAIGLSTTSSSPEEWMRSLPTLTPAAATPPTAPQMTPLSAIPS